MFTAAGQVDFWSVWHALDKVLERRKFAVCMNVRDSKTASEIEAVYFRKGLEHIFDLSIIQMVHRGEADVSAECYKERYLAHEENIEGKKNFLVEF